MGNDLRVNKLQQQVVLFMADGVIFDGVVHLSQYAMHHAGEETVLDLLLENNPFLPMHCSNGTFHLIRKGMISHLRCPLEPKEGIEYIERQVQISFLGNEALRGRVLIDLPPHSARLKEFINGGPEFFPLYSGDHSYLVNRSLIRDIVLLD